MWATRFVGDYEGVSCRFSAAVSGYAAGVVSPSCPYQGWTPYMAVWEPALTLGATVVGVTKTNHHTSHRAGPWRRILVAVGWTPCMAVWEPALPLGATFDGVT